MADSRRELTANTFDAQRFIAELNTLRASHGLLAIDALVMVRLDADYHHIFKAQTGVNQLSLDQVSLAGRYPELVKELP